MFETSAVESRVQQRSATQVAMLPVSLGAHALAAFSFVLVSVWSVAFPLNSPSQLSALVLSTQLPKMVIHKPEPVEPKPQPEVLPKENASAPSSPKPLVDAPPQVIPDTIPVLIANQLTGPLPKEVDWDFSGKGSNTQKPGIPGVDTNAVYGTSSEGVTVARVIHRVRPVYPSILQKVGMSGSAVVECIVGRDGSIVSVTVVDASHTLFGESAREAIMKWRFVPGRLNGTNVATVFELTVQFEAKR